MHGRGAEKAFGLANNTILFVVPQLILLQLFQLPSTPGIHHGIPVAFLLLSFKNHFLPKVC